MNDARGRDVKATYVEAYKTILGGGSTSALRHTPATRDRVGKNRSFVSHFESTISRPDSGTTSRIIFESCHFSPPLRSAPSSRLRACSSEPAEASSRGASFRVVRLEVFDFGNANKNREFDGLVRETARRLVRHHQTSE